MKNNCNMKRKHELTCTFKLSLHNSFIANKAQCFHLTRWCAGHPLQILLHCQGQGSSSSPLSELKRAEAAPLLPPDKKRGGSVLQEFTSDHFCFNVEITVFCTSSSSSSSSEPLSSLSERGATSYLQRTKMSFTPKHQQQLQLIFQLNNFSPLLKLLSGRYDTDPGFISSQASSWPALGASTPVRIFPLSTWMTFTGRSLIWLVSSKGWGRKTMMKTWILSRGVSTNCTSTLMMTSSCRHDPL